MQGTYMKSLLIALGVAGVLDFIVAVLDPNVVLYAGATLISCLIWLGLNMNKFKYMIPSKKETGYVTALLISFIILCAIDSIIIRALLYLILYLALTYVLMNGEWNYAISQWKHIKEKGGN